MGFFDDADAGLLNPFKQDIEAIDRFIMGAEVKTDEARRIRDEDWIQFFQGLDGLFSPFNQAAFDEARNKRNAFERANVTSPEEAAKVEQVLTDGVSSEEARGETDRRTSTGDFAIPPPAEVPPWVKWAVGLALLGAGLWALTEVTALTKAVRGK